MNKLYDQIHRELKNMPDDFWVKINKIILNVSLFYAKEIRSLLLCNNIRYSEYKPIRRHQMNFTKDSHVLAVSDGEVYLYDENNNSKKKQICYKNSTKMINVESKGKAGELRDKVRTCSKLKAYAVRNANNRYKRFIMNPFDEKCKVELGYDSSTKEYTIDYLGEPHRNHRCDCHEFDDFVMHYGLVEEIMQV